MSQRNVFITGASRGLGRSIALEYAKAGYGVAFTYNNRKDAADAVLAELRELNSEARYEAWQLDVRDPARVEEVVDQATDAFDEIQAVINNAGVNANNAAAFMTDEEWATVLETNLYGPFYVARQFLPHFLSMRHGRLIFISSIAADGTSGQINYSAAKSGLYGMCRSLAKEYGPKGITANIVVPGVFQTDMTKETLSDGFREYWLQFCPVRRFGNMPELTRLILFLTSEDGAFVNGESIQVTGGLNYSP